MLSGPGPARVGGDLGDVHLAAAVLDSPGRRSCARSPVGGRAAAHSGDALPLRPGGGHFAARRALQMAVDVAEPLDLLRPFVNAGPVVREPLAQRYGSLEAADAFGGGRWPREHVTVAGWRLS